MIQVLARLCLCFAPSFNSPQRHSQRALHLVSYWSFSVSASLQAERAYARSGMVELSMTAALQCQHPRHLLAFSRSRMSAVPLYTLYLLHRTGSTTSLWEGIRESNIATPIDLSKVRPEIWRYDVVAQWYRTGWRFPLPSQLLRSSSSRSDVDITMFHQRPLMGSASDVHYRRAPNRKHSGVFPSWDESAAATDRPSVSASHISFKDTK